MNNPDISSSSSSIMPPSTSHTRSTLEASPFRGHSMRIRLSMPPPRRSPEIEMGILRADSGIAIPPDTNNAIPDTDQTDSQSSILKEGLLDTILTDAFESTSTFNINKISNTITKLVELNDYLRAILTPLPTTPTAHLDEFVTTAEISTEEIPPYTSAGKKHQEENPFNTPISTSTDTSGSTLADDMNDTISKINQILDQMSITRHFTSIIPPSPNDSYLIDPLIPKHNPPKGKERQKEQKQPPLQPTTNTTNPDLPTPILLLPSSATESTERSRRRKRHFGRTSKPTLSPTPLHIRSREALLKSPLGVEDEAPSIPTSDMLMPYDWMRRDAGLFPRAADSGPPSLSNPHPKPISNRPNKQEDAQPILTEPYNEPSISKPSPPPSPLASRPRDHRESKPTILIISIPITVSDYRRYVENVLLRMWGEKEKEKEKEKAAQQSI
ncbi:hypothetical protein H4I96_09542 [Botrytis cinerea]